MEDLPCRYFLKHPDSFAQILSDEQNLPRTNIAANQAGFDKLRHLFREIQVKQTWLRFNSEGCLKLEFKSQPIKC